MKEDANSIGLKLEGFASRRKHDYYPTPENVTTALMEYLNLPPSIIQEPCCGDGRMSRIIESFGHTVISSDIRTDTGYGMQGVDYLQATPWPCDAIITNPPFDKAEAIIRKAIAEAPVVAMLLKSQYWHSKKRTGLFRETNPTLILALNWRPDFDHGERGGSPVMECLWTVWNKGFKGQQCVYDVLEKPRLAA